jgi:hypothetical protein
MIPDRARVRKPRSSDRFFHRPDRSGAARSERWHPGL